MDEAGVPTRSQEGTPWALSRQDSDPIPDADSWGPECSLQLSAGPWVSTDPCGLQRGLDPLRCSQAQAPQPTGSTEPHRVGKPALPGALRILQPEFLNVP